MQKNKGYVWLIVLLVIAVVIGIIWTKRGNSSGEQATSTSETSMGDQEVSTESPVPSPAPTPKPVTTPSPTPAASKPTMTASGAYIIYYTSKGFSPAILTISRTSSVHFVNNAQAAMSIAPVDVSNQPYASFRQSKSVGTGGTFDYTFTAAGSYSYYNANNKTHVGIINVR